MADIRTKVTDTPTLEATLIDDEGNALDLSDTDVDEIKLYVDHPDDDVLVVNATPALVDEAAGEVEYNFSPGETARVGDHRAEFVVTYTTGEQFSTPRRGFIRLDFEETLDREAVVDEISADPDLSLTTLYTDEIRSNTGAAVNVHDTTDHQGNDITGVGSVATIAEDLTAVTPTSGVIRRHDGSGTVPAGFYHGSEDGTQWVGFGETSGNTI